jgi:hypothetical protein
MVMPTETYVTIDLGDAGSIKMQAVDLGGGGLVDAKDLVAPLAKLLDPVESLSKAVMDALKKAEPTSFTVELDFSIGIEAGGVLTVFGKASGNAAIKATLSWSKDAK